MGKARTDKYGRTKEQGLFQENQQLKKQISALRKQIARLDLGRYDTIRDIIEEHAQMETEGEKRQILESLKKSWGCHACTTGIMEIFVFNRGDGTFYYRVCDNAPSCGNRTQSQPYTPSVNGVMRGDSKKKTK